MSWNPLSTLRFLIGLAALLTSGSVLAGEAEPLALGNHDVVINGVRLWYKVAGQDMGTPVVFLHGGPGEGSQTFARFAGPDLERSRRMVYLDQRGSGRSERHWKKEYSIPLMVDDLEQLRRLWGVDRIALIGHSFGTVLALEYAAQYPQHVSHLVLSGTVVDLPAALDIQCARLERTDPAAYAKAVAALPQGSQRRCDVFAAGRAFIDANMYPDPAIMKLVDETDTMDGMSNNGDAAASLLAQGLMDYRFERTDRLTMPVLVIAGQEDHQTVIEPVRPFIAALPHGHLLEYEGRGHFMFVEDPKRFASDVFEFLKTSSR